MGRRGDRVRRRDIIALFGGAAAALAGQSAALAQPEKIWRVGVIAGGIRTPAYDGFLQGMRDFGYVAGKDYLVDWRFADGRYGRFATFAQEFVRLKTDVIFLGTAAAVDLVRQVTRTIPIVLGYSTDPVGSGLVTSLARPGGNITGLASSPDDSAAKHIELLAAVVPNLARVGLLLNPESSDYADVLQQTQAAADKAGVALVWADARRPAEIDNAFAAFVRQRVEAMKLAEDPFFFIQQQRLVDLSLAKKLPAIFAERDYVLAGGLMSYGESMKDFYRRAASFVDRIFKGARAGDLPMEQPPPTLVINRKAARALSLTLPPQVLAQAAEVIE
jgi:putative ABC transport system substrate-binding protein